MAQFDIYRVRGGELAVDCQVDLLDDLPTRLVAPLRSNHDATVGRLTPGFTVAGEHLTMLTPLVRGISRRDIEETIGSLRDHEYAIKIALDMLISGF